MPSLPGVLLEPPPPELIAPAPSPPTMQGKMSRNETPTDMDYSRLFSFYLCLWCYTKQNGLTRDLAEIRIVGCPRPVCERQLPDDLPTVSVFPYPQCDSVALAKAGLCSHVKAKQKDAPAPDCPEETAPPFHCGICETYFKSEGAPASHVHFKRAHGPPVEKVAPALLQPR